ncbi:hypothetical protein P170DRAFT_102410 [Aspergillus steynii IBT 23096]|uniref:Uncharacterized protein n=1 Tax=Aspergillus steynii IBT 23096 TaxID=1392250 RepID=A0A2I2GHQ1_9EURO|nr:uncharacterized protein P170DRAFT_102410 [Aspergillus steynii IBT 23096]PLB52367.1 hypothetical protein P170DRAFT_102410 [Aspergillus steynii IBT 23096]
MNLLLYSALRGDVRSFRFFLENGFDPNSRARDGFSVLHASLLRGDVQKTQTLMAYRPNINVSYRGGTPIVLACEVGPKENVELLLESGHPDEIVWDGQKASDVLKDIDPEAYRENMTRRLRSDSSTSTSFDTRADQFRALARSMSLIF